MNLTHKIILTSGKNTKTFYYSKKPNRNDREDAIKAFGHGWNVSLEVSKVNLKKVS